MSKIVVDKQKMLAHKINSGVSVCEDSCYCIKGAFLDAVVDLPEIPVGVVVRQDGWDDLDYAYNALIGHYYYGTSRYTGYQVWRQEFPAVVRLLDKYEERLMNNWQASQEERQQVLKDCVAALEELELVEWAQKECIIT